MEKQVQRTTRGGRRWSCDAFDWDCFCSFSVVQERVVIPPACQFLQASARTLSFWLRRSRCSLWLTWYPRKAGAPASIPPRQKVYLWLPMPRDWIIPAGFMFYPTGTFL